MEKFDKLLSYQIIDQLAVICKVKFDVHSIIELRAILKFTQLCSKFLPTALLNFAYDG